MAIAFALKITESQISKSVLCLARPGVLVSAPNLIDIGRGEFYLPEGKLAGGLYTGY